MRWTDLHPSRRSPAVIPRQLRQMNVVNANHSVVDSAILVAWMLGRWVEPTLLRGDRTKNPRVDAVVLRSFLEAASRGWERSEKRQRNIVAGDESRFSFAVLEHCVVGLAPSGYFLNFASLTSTVT